MVGDSSLCLLFAHLEADVVQRSKGAKALKDEYPNSHDLAEEPPTGNNWPSYHWSCSTWRNERLATFGFWFV